MLIIKTTIYSALQNGNIQYIVVFDTLFETTVSFGFIRLNMLYNEHNSIAYF